MLLNILKRKPLDISIKSKVTYATFKINASMVEPKLIQLINKNIYLPSLNTFYDIIYNRN